MQVDIDHLELILSDSRKKVAARSGLDRTSGVKDRWTGAADSRFGPRSQPTDGVDMRAICRSGQRDYAS